MAPRKRARSTGAQDAARQKAAVSRPKLRVSSQAPQKPFAPAAPQSNAVPTSGLGKAQQAQASADAGAVRDHCKFQRGLLVVAYSEQLEGKYGALPMFKTWFERFIAALWEGLNENVKRDIPRKRDFRDQVICAYSAASQITHEIDCVVCLNAVESVYRQLQSPKTLWELWTEKSTPLFPGTERMSVIASDADLTKARERHVPSTLRHTKDIGDVAQLIRESGTRVIFLHGESGSGKTVCATRAAHSFWDPVVTIYIRCDAAECEWGRRERMNTARAFVKAKVEEALGHFPDVACTRTTRVIIILDDMGRHPQLARGICATHATIAHEVRARLMLGGKPVNIVCVGTGVEGAEIAPGSEAPYYVLHRITTTNLWQQWTKKARQYAELRKVMAEPGAWSMLATAMVENARAAALFKAYVSRHLHLCTTRSFVPCAPAMRGAGNGIRVQKQECGG